MPSSSRPPIVWLRRGLGLLLLAALLLPALSARGAPALRPAWLPRVEAQRVELLNRVGGLVTSGIPLDGDTALVAEGSSLVQMHLSPAASRVLDQVDLGHGIILDLTHAGPFFYALTEEGVVVLQARDGELPEAVSFVPGSGQSLEAHGRLVVVAAREAGLRVIAVEPDGAIGSVALLPLDGQALDIDLSADGRTAFVAAGGKGVALVDLSDPAAPRVRGALPQITPAEALGAAGSLLIVGGGERAVIADPAAGSDAVVGVYSPLRSGRRIAADDQYLYVADASDGLKILRLAASDHPVQVYGETDHPAQDLWLDGDRLYVVGADGLRILDLTDRVHPFEVARVALGGEPQGIALGLSRAYVALGRAGVAEIDVEDPAAPRVLRQYGLPGTARDVLLDDRVLYVAAGEAGLIAIDFDAAGGGTPREPVELPGPALDIARRDRWLYIAGGEAGLIGVDTSYPGQLLLSGVLPPDEGRAIESILLVGKRAYLSDGEGMTVADVSYAHAMGRLTRVRVPAGHVAARGVYLYVLHGDRITVYDARATAEPLHMRTYTALGHISRVAAEGERVFLSGAGDGPSLVVLDISRPDSPVEQDSVAAGGEALRAWPSRGEVWLARGYGGLSRYGLGEGGLLAARGAYSVSGEVGRINADGPGMLVGGRGGWSLLGANGDGEPTALAQSPDDVPVRGLAASGDRVAVAAGEQGVALYTVDPSASARPSLIAQRESRGAATGVALDDRFVYVADADGLAIYDNRYLQPVTSVAMPAAANDIVRRENLAYFPLVDGRVSVVDLADPTGGLRVHSIFATRWPADLLASPDGRTVYALTDNDRLTQLRTSRPEELISVGFHNLPQRAARAGFTDGWLWMLQPGEALYFYDPQHLPELPPELQRTIETRAQEVELAPPVAYLALGEEGLALLEINRPGTDIIFDERRTRDLLLEGPVLFAAGETLTAWDVSGPGVPQLRAELALPSPGRHVERTADGLLVSLESGMLLARWDGEALAEIGQLSTDGPVDRGVQIRDRAFLALHRGGLLVVDLSDPASPVRLYSYTSAAGQYVYDLMPQGEDTLLVSWEGGVEALDVSQVKPTPRLVNVVESGGSQALGLSLTRDGARAAVAMGEEGVALLDLGDAGRPEVAGYADTPGGARRAALSGTDLYVADGTCGLRVIDMADPDEPRETGYWRSSYASDVALGAGGEVYLAEANQLLTLRYDPDAPPVLPPIPQFPEPADGQDGAPLGVSLAWGPPPGECNAVTYNVYFGVTASPPFIGQVVGEPVLGVADLDPLHTYRWWVEATDRQGDTIQGPVWRFTTAAADYPDSYPPAPPPLVDRVQQNPAVPVLLGLAALTALAAGVIVWRRRREPRPTDRPDWTYTDDD